MKQVAVGTLLLLLLIGFGHTQLALPGNPGDELVRYIAPAGGKFGIPVSGFGENKVVVGAYTASVDGVGCGTAYVYAAHNGIRPCYRFVYPTPQNSDLFGYGIAGYGNKVVVSAHSWPAFGARGKIFLFVSDFDDFDFDDPGLTPPQNPIDLSPVDSWEAQGREVLGQSLAVDGNLALVSAEGWDNGRGAARLFDMSGGTLNEITRPDGSPLFQGSAPGDRFSFQAVALKCGRVAIGAVDHDVTDENGTYANAGEVKAYVANSDGTWREIRIPHPEPQAEAKFGWAVAWVGDYLLVGASLHDGTVGRAYLIDPKIGQPGEEPTTLLTIPNPRPTTNDRFGHSVAAVGPNLLVGAYLENNHAGAVYLFDGSKRGVYEDLPLLTIDNPDVAAADIFGHNVGSLGEDILVGAPGGGPGGVAYRFQGVPLNEPPVADAGDDREVACLGEFTPVQLDGTGSYDPDGDEIEFEWSVPEGATIDDPTSPTPTVWLPLGPSLITLTVTDGNGGFDCSDVLITVVDEEPPALICSTDKIALWPPNHEMVEVQVCVEITDNCTDFTEFEIQALVSSNEPDDATGDGAFTGDVDGFDGFAAPVPITLSYAPILQCHVGTVQLRAERDGAASGRVYSITCEVQDYSGNPASASCVVVVPHDKRKK